MNNQKITKIASIVIGVIVAVVIMVMGFRLLAGVFTRASDVEPRDGVISDISQNNAKISWSTGTETQTVIEYGNTPTALNFFAPETQKNKSHSVDLTLLSPNSTYYFQIRIGETKYDNGGVPWTFTTKDIAKSQGPTTIPSSTKTQPSPIQTVVIPTTINTCTETSCAAIKTKLGQGCNTQDYFKCLRKLTPTATASATP
jgi:hypothetical protein